MTFFIRSLVFIIPLFFIVPYVSAQSGQSGGVPDASVSESNYPVFIKNARLVSTPDQLQDHVLRIGFTIDSEHLTEAQELRYQFLLQKKTDDAYITIDSKISEEIISVGSATITPVVGEYRAPAYAEGVYTVLINAVNLSGTLLGTVVVGEVKLKSLAPYVEIIEETCNVQVVEGSSKQRLLYPRTDMPLLKHEDALVVICDVRNSGDTEVTVRPVISTYATSTEGALISRIPDTELTIPPEKTVTQQFLIRQPEGNQSSYPYAAVLALDMSPFGQVSNTINLLYRVAPKDAINPTSTPINVTQDTDNNMLFAQIAIVLVGAIIAIALLMKRFITLRKLKQGSINTLLVLFCAMTLWFIGGVESVGAFHEGSPWCGQAQCSCEVGLPDGCVINGNMAYWSCSDDPHSGQGFGGGARGISCSLSIQPTGPVCTVSSDQNYNRGPCTGFCANGAANYPTCMCDVSTDAYYLTRPFCSGSCANGYTNYPTCAPPACTISTDSNYNRGPCTGTCANGGTNYPSCTPNCTITTDSNYNRGPCAGTCANGYTNYPTCTPPACTISTDSNYNRGPCSGTCANGYTNYPTCTPPACTISTDSNYNRGPCSGTCANGNTNYPACTTPPITRCTVSTDPNYNIAPCAGFCANGNTNYPACTTPPITRCTVPGDSNFNIGPCTGLCTNGGTNYPTCTPPVSQLTPSNTMLKLCPDSPQNIPVGSSVQFRLYYDEDSSFPSCDQLRTAGNDKTLDASWTLENPQGNNGGGTITNIPGDKGKFTATRVGRVMLKASYGSLWKEAQIIVSAAQGNSLISGPSVTFELCDLDGSNCSSNGSQSVPPSIPKLLKWNAPGICDPITPNFSTGSTKNGSTQITTPASGSQAYTIACQTSSQPVQKTITITSTTGENPTLSVTREGSRNSNQDVVSTVKIGDTIRLWWDTKDIPESTCTIRGGGESGNLPVEGQSNTGSKTITIHGKTTFVVNCAGREKSVTVEVIPQQWDS